MCCYLKLAFRIFVLASNVRKCMLCCSVLWCPVLEGANSTSAVDLCSISNQCINLWSLQDGPCKVSVTLLAQFVSLRGAKYSIPSKALVNFHDKCSTQLCVMLYLPLDTHSVLYFPNKVPWYLKYHFKKNCEVL